MLSTGARRAVRAWVLFVLIFIITFIQLRLQKQWVYYEAE